MTIPHRVHAATHVLELFCSSLELVKLGVTGAAPRALVDSTVELLLGLSELVLCRLGVVVDSLVFLLELGVGLLKALNLVLVVRRAGD